MQQLSANAEAAKVEGGRVLATLQSETQESKETILGRMRYLVAGLEAALSRVESLKYQLLAATESEQETLV